MSCIFSINSAENPNCHSAPHFTEKGTKAQRRKVLTKVNNQNVPEPARKCWMQDQLPSCSHSLTPALSEPERTRLGGTYLFSLK